MELHQNRAGASSRPAGFSGRPTKAYPAGRVCCYPACKTLLSVYNSGSLCGAHSRGEPIHGKPVLYACLDCGAEYALNADNFYVRDARFSRRCKACDRSRENDARSVRRRAAKSTPLAES